MVLDGEGKAKLHTANIRRRKRRRRNGKGDERNFSGRAKGKEERGRRAGEMPPPPWQIVRTYTASLVWSASQYIYLAFFPRLPHLAWEIPLLDISPSSTLFFFPPFRVRPLLAQDLIVSCLFPSSLFSPSKNSREKMGRRRKGRAEQPRVFGFG